MAIAIKMDRVPIEHETVLWENPSPTAAFTAQTITVMQSIRDFKKIRIYWYYYNTLSIGPGYIDVPVRPVDFFYNVDDQQSLQFVIGDKNTNNTFYIRYGYFTADSIYFGTGKQWNSTTTSNTHCIPYKVTGISRREIIVPSRGNERIDVLWTNPTPNSAMESGTDVTLVHGAEKYDILRVYHKPNASDTISEADRWVDFYIGKEPEKFTPDSYNSRLTFGDLVINFVFFNFMHSFFILLYSLFKLWISSSFSNNCSFTFDNSSCALLHIFFFPFHIELIHYDNLLTHNYFYSIISIML